MGSVIAYVLMCLVLASELFVSSSELFVPSSPHPHDACYEKNENMRSLSIVTENSSLVLSGFSTTKICGFFYMNAEKCICQDFATESYRLFMEGENDFFVFSKLGHASLQAKKYAMVDDIFTAGNDVDVAQTNVLLANILRREKNVFCYNGKSVLNDDKDGLCSCHNISVPCSSNSVSLYKIFCNQFETKDNQFTITNGNGVFKTFPVAAEFRQLQVWNKNWNAEPIETCQDISATTTATPPTEITGPTTSTSLGSESNATENSETLSPSSSTEDTNELEISSESTAELYTTVPTNVAHAGSNNMSTLLYSGIGVGSVLMILGALIILAVLFKWIPGVYVDPRKVQLKPSRDQIFG